MKVFSQIYNEPIFIDVVTWKLFKAKPSTNFSQECLITPSTFHEVVLAFLFPPLPSCGPFPFHSYSPANNNSQLSTVSSTGDLSMCSSLDSPSLLGGKSSYLLTVGTWGSRSAYFFFPLFPVIFFFFFFVHYPYQIDPLHQYIGSHQYLS